MNHGATWYCVPVTDPEPFFWLEDGQLGNIYQLKMKKAWLQIKQTNMAATMVYHTIQE